MKLTSNNQDDMDCRVPGRATGVTIPPEMEDWVGIKPDGKPVRPVMAQKAVK